jgi:putative FmdB family regulatory protein
MPIFEYTCQACGHQFEFLVRGQASPACPSCKSKKLQRLWSLPSVVTPGTRAKGLKAARKRDAAQATDRMHERLKYEESHDRHG